MWLACYSQEEISAATNEQVGTIGRLIADDNFLHSVLENQTKKVVAEHVDDFEPPIYNVWKQQEKTAGSKIFGNSEIGWLDNLLYLYTKPFDVIVDPFGGSGSTIDLCKRRLRRYLVSDRKPVIEREKEIRTHDITAGPLAPPQWKALVETWPIGGVIVDCCAPQGSGIVDWLNANGHTALCVGAVDFTGPADWIVTNPPYKRPLVDEIANTIAHRVAAGDAQGAALLMRPSWDQAACRAELFASLLYRGQTRMRFRAWWSEERKANPIHNFVWHVWTRGEGEPVSRYWP